MKTESIVIKNSECRKYPEFRAAIYQEFLNCQNPLAKIEAHESTADALMKICRILSQKGVEIRIDYNYGNSETPKKVNVRLKKGHIKHEAEFTEGRETPRDLEVFFMKQLVFFED